MFLQVQSNRQHIAYDLTGGLLKREIQAALSASTSGVGKM